MSFAQAMISKGYHNYKITPSQKQTLQRGLETFQKEKTFRFPNINPEIQDEYLPPYIDTFNTLYDIGTDIFTNLEHHYEKQTEKKFPVKKDTLLKPVIQVGELLPFMKHNAENAFQTSFFNLFNYDYGSLNWHKDRCLVTVVFGYPQDATWEKRSGMWIRDLTGEIVNGDEVVGEGEVLVFVGEDMERMTDGFYGAVEHCCRVDPHGDYLLDSFRQRDPEAPEYGNRLSTALILSQ